MFSASQDRRSRVISALLSLGLIALLFAMLISMGMVDLNLKPGGGESVISVDVHDEAQAEHHQTHATTSSSHKATNPIVQPKPVQPSPVTPPVPATSFIHLSHEEFASADISHMSKPESQADSGANSGSSTTQGPGEGPGGVHLYNAQWYRHPSDTALSSYMTSEAPPGSWGEIACRTIEHYHVEDCEELDESPPGTGLSRAMRRAAWQFLVRPPRINGQSIIGAWVRIRFIITPRPSSGDGPVPPS